MQHSRSSLNSAILAGKIFLPLFGFGFTLIIGGNSAAFGVSLKLDKPISLIDITIPIQIGPFNIGSDPSKPAKGKFTSLQLTQWDDTSEDFSITLVGSAVDNNASIGYKFVTSNWSSFINIKQEDAHNDKITFGGSSQHLAAPHIGDREPNINAYTIALSVDADKAEEKPGGGGYILTGNNSGNQPHGNVSHEDQWTEKLTAPVTSRFFGSDQIDSFTYTLKGNHVCLPTTNCTKVPEPSSILGTLVFGAGVVLKRKWKLSKRTKKEIEQAC